MNRKIFKLIMMFMAFGALVAFGSTPALSQESRIDDEAIYSPEEEADKYISPDWGLKDFISHPSSADEFVGLNATYDNYIQFTGSRRYCSSACTLENGLTLPQGARIIGWELDAYDVGSGSVSLTLARCGYNSNSCPALGATTTTSGTPGFTSVGRSLSHTVNNWTGYYFFEAQLSAGSSYGIVGALVTYRLQVSPSPGSATFWDVPLGHPYNRFVEAMYRSGITAGCGGGAYCVDDPITRGEMAVFLAAALGLHYPY